MVEGALLIMPSSPLGRIDQEHRLVYRVENDILTIIQCRYHY